MTHIGPKWYPLDLSQLFILFIPNSKYDWVEGKNNIKTTKTADLRELTVDDDVIGAGAGLYGSIFGILLAGIEDYDRNELKLISCIFCSICSSAIGLSLTVIWLTRSTSEMLQIVGCWIVFSMTLSSHNLIKIKISVVNIWT